MSRYQKGKPIWILLKLETDNHASIPLISFLQAGCPSCHPTNSIKALKAQSLDWYWQTKQYRKIQINKLNTNEKSKQPKMQQNKTTLVQLPLTTLGQETRWAYSATPPSPHRAMTKRTPFQMFNQACQCRLHNKASNHKKPKWIHCECYVTIVVKHVTELLNQQLLKIHINFF